MTPSLDYRIDALLSLLRIKIDALRSFHHQGEAHFNIEFDKFKAETDHLTVAEWEHREDFYIGQRDELESLRELKRHFAIAGLFNVFETFLRDALDQLRSAGVAVPPRKPKERWYLDKMKDIFAAVRVPITKPDRDWNAIKKLQAFRHCITHRDGYPGEEDVRILKCYNVDVPQDVWIELPARYLEESAVLVENVCDRIVNDCKSAFPGGQ